MTKNLKIPNIVNNEFNAITKILNRFCGELLNDEYYELSVKLTATLARKRPSPLLSGKANTWASGIIHALGMVNFLFDKTQTPHIKSSDIANWFNLSQNTISAKSKSIRDTLKISQFDAKWMLPSRIIDDPIIWLVQVNGCVIDIREAPREIQEEAFEAGVIPFILSDK